ncbi:hypothetical protein QBC35DRAFT_457704, partial [Podospora australis]
MHLISILAHGLLASTATAAATIRHRQTDDNREGPVEPDTAADCTWFDTAHDASYTCEYFATWWGISVADFISYNPSVGADCSNIKIGNSYCIERNWGIPDPVTSTSTTSSAGPTGTATPCNANAPIPTQPVATCGCKKWHLVAEGDYCANVIDRYGIDMRDLYKWNSNLGGSCDTMWLGYYI